MGVPSVYLRQADSHVEREGPLIRVSVHSFKNKQFQAKLYFVFLAANQNQRTDLFFVFVKLILL